jgi:hypothetical protein
MRLRRLLIQLILLSMLFNALIVAPLHAAMHLNHEDHPAQSVASHDMPAGTIEAEHQRESVCLLCLAPSNQPFEFDSGSAFKSFTGIVAAAQHPALRANPVFRANPDHWPFSSRDPPHA